MQIKEKLENLLRESLKSLFIEAGEVFLEHPGNVSHGDYSTNTALVYGKKSGKNPRELAGEIFRYIERNQPKELERVEVAGPGFINFYLSKNFFAEVTGEIVKEKENWGRNENLLGQKIIIEYTQPNPFKEFHIGHLVNNIVGEAISRIIEAENPELKRVTYHGDVGLHVAKAIWAMQKKDWNPDSLPDWGKSYASGDKAYEDNEESKKEITEINKKIYEKSDPKINKLYKQGRELSLKYFEEIYTRLGSKFDHNFFESEAGNIGKELVEKFLEKKVFEKSQGAIIFPKEKSDLHTRVFINSEGLPTYEAKDLGLIQLKKDFFDFDRSITVTDVEQTEYYKVVTKSAEFVFPKLKGRIEHISHGRLRLPEGRMSSRTGNIISGETLLNDLYVLAVNKMKERQIKNKKEIAEQIAIAALKYSILKQAPGKNIIFDPDKSLSFEGDSGPYLQYTAVRAKAILEKAKAEKIEPGLNTGKEVIGVEQFLYRFPEVVERSAKEYSPHQVLSFLLELAGIFNSFYAKEKIVDKENKNSPYRIALAEAVLITLQNGLWLLGIETPEKM